MLLLPITCPLIHPVCCTINCTVRVHYEIYVFFISSNSKCHYKQMSPPRFLQEQKRDQKQKEQLLLLCCNFFILKLWKTKIFLFLKHIRFYQMWENFYAIWRIEKLKNLITVFITTCNTIKIRNTVTEGQCMSG